MSIEDIFKDAPELLEKESVKRLLKYIALKERHHFRDVKRIVEWQDKVLMICINSTAYVKGGMPAEDAIREIFELN